MKRLSCEDDGLRRPRGPCVVDGTVHEFRPKMGRSDLGANVDFPKYFEKYDRLVRKEKFPEIYHTCDKILLFIYEYSSQSYCAHSAHVALVDDR